MDAGVGEFVDQDQIVRADQGWNNAGIGKIPRSEHASRLGAFKPRQSIFQLGIERMIAGHEPRRAGADAVMRGGRDGGGDHLGMLTEIEIIVARERQQTAAIALSPDAGTRRDHRRAAELRPFQRSELLAGKLIERTHQLPFPRTNVTLAGPKGTIDPPTRMKAPNDGQYQ